MGYDPVQILAAVESWQARENPYPSLIAPPAPPNGGPAPIKVTPGNARKGESGTYTGVPGTNNGRGRG
jgi:hypothetical protein